MKCHKHPKDDAVVLITENDIILAYPSNEVTKVPRMTFALCYDCYNKYVNEHRIRDTKIEVIE